MKPGQARQPSEYPVFPQGLPDRPVSAGKYRIRFATSPDELDAIQRLRYEVFNLELGEGLDESHRTGRDQDRYDAACHHLMVVDKRKNQTVGTYRMQTNAMAKAFGGFYTADEFCLDGLPADLLENAVEVGRASVARSHRNRMVLFLLWRGLASYMRKNEKRYLFGCCSLTSQDPREGKRVMDYLERNGHVHETLRAAPKPGWECYPEDLTLDPAEAAGPASIPKLFGLYLRYGARVCGPPAIDRFFKTIDYLVVLDLHDLGPGTRSMYFG